MPARATTSTKAFRPCGRGPRLGDGPFVVVGRQVPVGPCEQMAAVVRQANPSLRFGIAYVPENLRLGQAIQGFKQPEMMVIGADSEATLRRGGGVPCPLQTTRGRGRVRAAAMTE